MLIGFMAKFAAYVEQGSKTHTIRARRKDGQKVKLGDTCHCYTGLRQKGSRLLGRWPCVRVQNIRIASQVRYRMDQAPLFIWIDEVLLTDDEAEAFMVRDGFRTGTHPNFPAMTEARLHWGRTLETEAFEGDLIHWQYREGTNGTDTLED